MKQVIQGFLRGAFYVLCGACCLCVLVAMPTLIVWLNVQGHLSSLTAALLFMCYVGGGIVALVGLCDRKG